MPNKKRKVSLDDYAACYQYFHRAIQNNRFMKGEQHATVRASAIQSFGELKSNAPDEENVRLFQLWIDDFVDPSTWSRCYRALNQKKYLVEHNQRTITISNEAHNVLKNLSNKKNISFSQLIIDGCAFLQGSAEESIKLSDKARDVEALRSLNVSKTPVGAPGKLVVPVTSVSSNVISLFSEDLIESSDDEAYESELDSCYFDEVHEWPRKPEGYDFRINESYKKYRKNIKRLTIKKPDEELLEYFNKTINYYLTEDNCHQIGPQLLSIRHEILEKNLFFTEFDPDLFSISKGFNLPNLTMDDYADELLFLLERIFGCTTQTITAGNRQPTVFAGHPNHVQLAYKAYHYLDAFLSDEVKRFAERCHKNTKRKNRIARSKWHGCQLVGTMLNSIIDDDEDYMCQSKIEMSGHQQSRNVRCTPKLHEPHISTSPQVRSRS